MILLIIITRFFFLTLITGLAALQYRFKRQSCSLPVVIRQPVQLRVRRPSKRATNLSTTVTPSASGPWRN